MRREPFQIKRRRIFMKPQLLIGEPVNAHNDRDRHVEPFEVSTPLWQHLTVPSEHDRLGRIPREVDRDLPPAVVVENLATKFSHEHECIATTSWDRWRAREPSISSVQRRHPPRRSVICRERPANAPPGPSGPSEPAARRLLLRLR